MPISCKDRFTVLSRDRFACVYCGRSAPDVALEVDHLHARALGGKNDLSNYVTACHDCNAGKGDRLLAYGQAALTEHDPLVFAIAADVRPSREKLPIILEGAVVAAWCAREHEIQDALQSMVKKLRGARASA